MTGPSSTGAAAAALAIVVDRAFGEPPVDPHPVAAFGRLMAGAERRWWASNRRAGLRHLALGTVPALALGCLLDEAARRALGSTFATTTASTYLAVAGRSLDDAARAVEAALVEGDVDRARQLLPSLVGRDPTGLDAAEIARAVVESVAENTVDAVVAPAVWGAVAGSAGALSYRCTNTLDAMVGHRSERYERFGWASARADDVANLLPARLAAVLVAAVRPRRAVAVARAVRRDAPAHPSPNGGVVEAAFAAALGIRLGGPSRYHGRDEVRPTLGDGPPVAVHHIAEARRLALHVDLVLAAALGGTAAIRVLLSRRGRPSGIRGDRSDERW